MNAIKNLSIGWYGKLPSLGDFVSRRLPANFVNPWDTWLQEGIAISRSQLGAKWEENYLTSPIWRFVIMPGAYGNAGMWTGILMPSVDKVGRYFPLTIAINIELHSGMIQTVLAAQTWYAAIEQVALSALDFDISPDALDNRLAQYPFPVTLIGFPVEMDREFIDWWQNKTAQDVTKHKAFHFSTADALTNLFESMTREALKTTGTGKSIWWNVEFETGNTVLHFFDGLPPPSYFATLLTNDAK